MKRNETRIKENRDLMQGNKSKGGYVAVFFLFFALSSLSLSHLLSFIQMRCAIFCESVFLFGMFSRRNDPALPVMNYAIAALVPCCWVS
jgi:hypothetical protein